MTMILIFLVAYVAASAWDVHHVNDLLGRIVDPGRRKPANVVPLPPAPRLVINLPSRESATGSRLQP